MLWEHHQIADLSQIRQVMLDLAFRQLVIRWRLFLKPGWPQPGFWWFRVLDGFGCFQRQSLLLCCG